MENTIIHWLDTVKLDLDPISDTPALDARVLLGEITGQSQAWLLAHPEAQLSEAQLDQLLIQVSQLEDGKPLPFVLGHWDFYGLTFHLTPDVLIPRPETELLVEQALTWLAAHPIQRHVLDIGTGSGCIAISLARSVPGLQVFAGDISYRALQVARENARKNEVDTQVKMFHGDLADCLTGPFDLICANLPYIPEAEAQHLKVYNTEPVVALVGGIDGLVLIRRLLQDAGRILAPGGAIFLEIEAGQGKSTADLACRYFPRARVTVQQDLAGLDRLLICQT